MSLLKGFLVTYDHVTPESAADGETSENGWIDCISQRIPLYVDESVGNYDLVKAPELTFRDAVNAWDASGCQIEPDSGPMSIDCPPRWLTACPPSDERFDDIDETRSIHFPDSVTASSRIRFARLCGVR